ncbi:MAG: xylulokinase [Gammaproteobacteria bacterium]|nr:MAG: xylulokinase [Gammaproteobacteria bacterium]
MYIGIDLGTSAVKAVLIDEQDRVVDTASAPLTVSRPRPLWSEQDPEGWWTAADQAVLAMRARQERAFAAVRAVGLSGQMHGATLLDAEGRVIRPAILWNDGRSHAECAWLEETVPDLPRIAGNRAMPGFTAPKLVWLRRHEPEAYARVAKVLLPKDYLRWRMTGEYASDMSDSAGTLWMNVAERRWAPELLEACGLNEGHMPRLFEGTEITGRLRPEVADRWGLGTVPVVGGGGDNAAGAVGANVIEPGTAFVSLGTSGVYFVSSGEYRANPQGGVHAFCHCLPGRWHQMSVILSAASCLSWLKGVLGAASEAEMLAEAEGRPLLRDPAEKPLFLPYLSGERTPHNNPYAKGVFFGLTHATERADLVIAVLEGVAFAFADGQQALYDAGTAIEEVSVIGGGAASVLWGRILASVLGRKLIYREGAELGPAFGAARLARFGDTGRIEVEPQPIRRVAEPEPELQALYARLWPRYRALYQTLEAPFFSAPQA